jgi:hypothetical protein
MIVTAPNDEYDAKLARILRLEPRLVDLFEWATFYSVPLFALVGYDRRDALCWPYERLKSYLVRYVGWGGAHPELRTPEAYDIAHREMLLRLEGGL